LSTRLNVFSNLVALPGTGVIDGRSDGGSG
jgi:hypothetical protein